MSHRLLCRLANASQRIRGSNRDPAHEKCCRPREGATEGGAGASKAGSASKVDMMLSRDADRCCALDPHPVLSRRLYQRARTIRLCATYSELSSQTVARPLRLSKASHHRRCSQAMLEAHNAIRARVGVPPLVWSDQLAEVAQDWANHLIATGGLSHRPNNRYGENIYTISGGTATPFEVVDLWAKEARGYDIRSNTCSGVCGHYTQIVWSKTRAVGCAVADAPRREIWVCNYDPPGNVIGYRPY